MAVVVTVEFETEAQRRFFNHQGTPVPLVAGKGRFTVEENEYGLVLFGIEGTPGTEAKITLSVPASASLEIKGHPIEGRIAATRTVWGDNRFFRVKV